MSIRIRIRIGKVVVDREVFRRILLRLLNERLPHLNLPHNIHSFNRLRPLNLRLFFRIKLRLLILMPIVLFLLFLIFRFSPVLVKFLNRVINVLLRLGVCLLCLPQILTHEAQLGLRIQISGVCVFLIQVLV